MWCTFENVFFTFFLLFILLQKFLTSRIDAILFIPSAFFFSRVLPCGCYGLEIYTMDIWADELSTTLIFLRIWKNISAITKSDSSLIWFTFLVATEKILEHKLNFSYLFPRQSAATNIVPTNKVRRFCIKKKNRYRKIFKRWLFSFWII